MEQHWWCDYCEVCLRNNIKAYIFLSLNSFSLGTPCRKQQGTQSDIMPFTIGGLEASTDIYALTGIFKIPAWTLLMLDDVFFMLLWNCTHWSILFWWRRILDGALLMLCSFFSVWLWWIHDIFHRCMCILTFHVCESMFMLHFTIHEWISKVLEENEVMRDIFIAQH